MKRLATRLLLAPVLMLLTGLLLHGLMLYGLEPSAELQTIPWPLLGAGLVGLTVAAVEGRRLSLRLTDYAAMLVQMRNHEFGTRQAGDGERELRRIEIDLNKLSRHMQQAFADMDGTSRQLSGMLNGMQEGVVVTDRQTRIILANQAIRQILRVQGPVLGLSLLEVHRSPELMAEVEAALQHAEPRSLDMTLRFSSVVSGGTSGAGAGTGAGALAGAREETRQVSVRLSRWLDQGTPAGVVCVLNDVTDVRRLEQVRRDFVANASHELRTPVAAIRGYAELLQGDDRLPADVLEFVDVIERNSVRLSALVNDILSLAHIEAPDYRPQLETIELLPLASAVVRGLEGLARKRNVSLKLDLPSVLPTVVGEPRGLEQIISNLVDNALKYTPPGGMVTVRARPTAGSVLLEIEDTGVGIPPADIERVFERFYRVDSARSRAVGGTGLGLSIVKHLVQALGGEVSVSSTYGAGSTFTVRLQQAGTTRFVASTT